MTTTPQAGGADEEPTQGVVVLSDGSAGNAVARQDGSAHE